MGVLEGQGMRHTIGIIVSIVSYWRGKDETDAEQTMITFNKWIEEKSKLTLGGSFSNPKR
jgi:hypothetical protein